jgi:hypothetical protein
METQKILTEEEKLIIEVKVKQLLDQYWISYKDIKFYTLVGEVTLGHDKLNCKQFICEIDDRKIVSYLDLDDLVNEVKKYCIRKMPEWRENRDYEELNYSRLLENDIRSIMDEYKIKYNRINCQIVESNTVVCFIDDKQFTSKNKFDLKNYGDLEFQVKHFFKEEINSYKETHDRRPYQWYYDYILNNTSLDERTINYYIQSDLLYLLDHQEIIKKIEEKFSEYFLNNRRKKILDQLLSGPDLDEL